MADVRANAGIPDVSAFSGRTTPTPSTPIIIDSATAKSYVLISNAVQEMQAAYGAGSKLYLFYNEGGF
tara:strand:- start:81 stop:284 length:204 start_codon:yes stop_codon:yes gene_type:complete